MHHISSHCCTAHLKATHVILPPPLKRTEKLVAALAAGQWVHVPQRLPLQARGTGSNILNVTPESRFTAISEVPPSSEAGRVYLSDWVINPQALLYQQFQAALLLLAILIGIIEPFNFAFLHTDNVLTPVNAFIYCTDTMFVSRGTCSSLRLNARRTSSHVPRPAPPQVFLSDVLLSFFVPEFRMGKWKTSLASIAVEYLRGMFWYDILAALPWDLVLKGVYQPTGTAAVALSAFGLLRLLRLIRLAPCAAHCPFVCWNVLWDMAVDVQYDYISTSVHKFALLILFATHWSACVFFLLARVRNFSEDTGLHATLLCLLSCMHPKPPPLPHIPPLSLPSTSPSSYCSLLSLDYFSSALFLFLPPLMTTFPIPSPVGGALRARPASAPSARRLCHFHLLVRCCLLSSFSLPKQSTISDACFHACHLTFAFSTALYHSYVIMHHTICIRLIGRAFPCVPPVPLAVLCDALLVRTALPARAMTTLCTTGTAPQVLHHRYRTTGIAPLVLHHRYMRVHVVPASLQEQEPEHLRLHFDTAEVRDDVLLHCPSSVRTLVKRHVYSRFINSSYLFAGTSNVFRVSPPPHLVLIPPLTSPLACGPPTCFVNSSYLFAGTSNIFRVSQHLPLTTRANVDFFLPHVDLVAAGNSTTELLIIASGQAQVCASWLRVGTARCRHSEVWAQRGVDTARCGHSEIWGQRGVLMK
ncbi:unnamed protein product [Closterium sp. Naga37s-1]|nr:unnamed protein product [Closterium sp. Naga37s-1]